MKNRKHESNPIEVRLDRRLVKTFKVGAEGPRDPWSAVPSASFYEQTADDRLEFPIAVSAGTRVLGVAFPRKSTLAEGVLEPRLSVDTYEYAGDRDAPMAVDSVSISGPFGAVSVGDTPSRRRLFTCYPVSPREEMPCATEILSRLAKRAYRRPVSDADVQPLLAFYRSGRAKGDFDAGIEIAVRAVLVDPEFFFRMERDPAGLPAGSVHRLSGLELASRLSFFLWSSIPDDRLLDVAAAGQLTANGVLERQTERVHRRVTARAHGVLPVLLETLAHRAPAPALLVALLERRTVGRRRRWWCAEDILEHPLAAKRRRCPVRVGRDREDAAVAK